jgi:hypothetical protein
MTRENEMTATAHIPNPEHRIRMLQALISSFAGAAANTYRGRTDEDRRAQDALRAAHLNAVAKLRAELDALLDSQP